MTEKLKFTVIYTETVNPGNYDPKKWGLIREFTEGQYTIAEAFTLVEEDVKRRIVQGE